MLHDSTDDAATESGCVVVTQRGAALSPDLLAACAGRGWQPIVFDDPYLAAAELCLLHRGAPDAAGPPLVLDDEGQATRLEAAARRLAPHASIWRHETGVLHRLSDPIPDRTPPVERPAAAPTAMPDAASARPTEDRPALPAQVTADEIALLFAETRGGGS
ncbi:MAG: hypothetical protein HKO59_13005 [Phycisphaerales bacterium]|nr:hypothetical protein [Phycisphaerae bacterium]NNF43783.1 hypothetical protein [Phycisphaerales bacterium]NNM26881.1 hypothetical protein [Phycisphaerales bacterium]